MERPWQRGEIPGPVRSVAIKDPKSLALMIKRAKRPIIIVGNKFPPGTNPLEIVVKIAKATNAHIVATGVNFKALREKGYEHVYLMPALEIVDRLRDPSWRGLDGKGQYDFAVFLGFPYYYEWLLLNGLKHVAYKHLKTISLDPYYHPNASYSLPNLTPDKWCSYLGEMVKFLTGE